MYSICKSVITGQPFELSNMLKKLDACWLKNQLTDEQHTELTQLARTKANPENGIDIMAKLNDLEMRVRKLEESGKPAETPSGAAAYKPGHWYYGPRDGKPGDRCTYKGAVYTCTAPAGQVCVWSPEDKPDWWQKEGA